MKFRNQTQECDASVDALKIQPCIMKPALKLIPNYVKKEHDTIFKK